MPKVIEIHASPMSSAIEDAIMDLCGVYTPCVDIQAAVIAARRVLNEGGAFMDSMDAAVRLLNDLRERRVQRELKERNLRNRIKYIRLRCPNLRHSNRVAFFLGELLPDKKEYYKVLGKAVRLLRGGSSPESAVLLSMGVDTTWREHAGS